MNDYNRSHKPNSIRADTPIIAFLFIEEYSHPTQGNYIIREQKHNDSGSPNGGSGLLGSMHSVSNYDISEDKNFRNLKEVWKSETAHLSSITEICMHTAYQQIIGMGQSSIPLILSEMEKEPDHWFWALQSITGENPVSLDQRGRVGEMTEAWLCWGRENRYLNESSENYTVVS